MLGLLQVVIGIVFLLLLLSLLVTTIMELITSALALRGKNLEDAIANMLANGDKKGEYYQKFTNNALYRQLSRYRPSGKKRPPSYMSPENFQSIVFQLINREEGSVRSSIEKIENNEELKSVLLQFHDEVGEDIEQFKGKIQGWYNDVMDRASGWFKRNIQIWVSCVGLAVAVIFNADTIAIFYRLESNPQALKEIVTMAETYVAAQPAEGLSPNTLNPSAAMGQINSLISQEIEQAKSPLGLGWNWDEIKSLDTVGWAVKILGWIVTALAMSLGAPFWFDLLKKLVNIRASGNKPA
jgi:hypothetical protein